MFFYNFKDFLIENKILDDIKSYQDDIDKLKKKLDKSKNKEEIQKKINKLENNIKILNKHIGVKDDIKEDIVKFDNGNLLYKWNVKYSQSFKFKNDMPQSVNKDSNIQDLLNVIEDDYKTNVSEALDVFIKIISSNKYKDREITISGFTSTPATEDYNLDLSERRAKIVSNVIQNMCNDKNIQLNVKLIEKGYGEDKKHLIIKNDTTTDTPIINKNYTLSDDILSEIEHSVDMRQLLNRRVMITIPEIADKKISIDTNNIPQLDETIVDNITLPEPSKISFNYDSYILTSEGQKTLDVFIDNVNKYNINNDKIKELYISSHTLKTETTKDEQANQNKLLFVLSCNRAIIVKKYLIENLKDDIKINIYPVSYRLGRRKEIVIEQNYVDSMQKANDICGEMCSKYNFSYSNNIGLKYIEPIKNIALRNVILQTLTQYASKGKSIKKIPIELIYNNNEYYGIGYEEGIDDFKKKINKIITKYNANLDDFVYKKL